MGSVIPDRIELVVAYRYWMIREGNCLGAANFIHAYGLPWPVLSPITCAHYIPEGGKYSNIKPLAIDYQNKGACIEPCKECGIHGVKEVVRSIQDFDFTVKILNDQSFVRGRVYLWGLIVEHELGYRAQYAYPKCLYLDGDKDNTIRMIASNYRIPAVEQPAMEPRPHFNSLVDLQRDTYNAISRDTGV